MWKVQQLEGSSKCCRKCNQKNDFKSADKELVKQNFTVHWREAIPKPGKPTEEEVARCVIVSVSLLEFHTRRIASRCRGKCDICHCRHLRKNDRSLILYFIMS